MNQPENIDRKRCFLSAVFALCAISSLKGEEQLKSARRNRLDAAEDAILRCCDIYLPGGLDMARIASICDVMDGPVNATIERYAALLFDAVSMVDEP